MGPFSFPFFFIIGGIALAVVIANSSKKSISNNFQLLAERLKLQFQAPPSDFFSSLFGNNLPSVSGQIGERYLTRVYMFHRGSGKNRVTYTAFDIELKKVCPHNLKIMSEGFFRKLGKALGMQADVEVRDPEFDSKFIIKCDNALFAKQVFADPDLREKFITYNSLFSNGSFTISGNTFHYEGIKSLYYQSEVDKIEDLINLALILIYRIEELDGQGYKEEEYKEW